MYLVMAGGGPTSVHPATRNVDGMSTIRFFH
jgi:hypothetical protein